MAEPTGNKGAHGCADDHVGLVALVDDSLEERHPRDRNSDDAESSK